MNIKNCFNLTEYRLLSRLNIKLKGFILISLSILLALLYLWHPKDKDFHLYFLDVGQGDCIVMTLEDLTILVDGGGDRFKSDDYNTGKTVVLPFLKSIGVNRLDYVFITHSHYDHIKGVLEVMEVMDTGLVIIPKVYQELSKHSDSKTSSDYDEYFQQGDEGDLIEELFALVRSKNIRIDYMEAKDYLPIKDLMITCLYPGQGQEYSEHQNENSLVLDIAYHDFSALLTGDIEENGEKWMVEQGGFRDKYQILKVPHHGSNSSSSKYLLDMSVYEHAIIQVGDNYFGHPSDIVCLRYKNYEIPIYTTKNYGMIEVDVTKDTYSLSAYEGKLEDENIKRTDKE